MQETIYSRNGCVFRPAGVVCEAGPGTACYGCGWHPRIEDARKAQAREKLRKRWKNRLRAATSSAAAAAAELGTSHAARASGSSPRGEGKGGGADV